MCRCWSENEIGEGGAARIAEALSTNTTLTRLNLRCEWIGLLLGGLAREQHRAVSALRCRPPARCGAAWWFAVNPCRKSAASKAARERVKANKVARLHRSHSAGVATVT